MRAALHANARPLWASDSLFLSPHPPLRPFANCSRPPAQPFSLDFLGCFLNVMENVSRAWTSDRQTFVLVLFLNHLSPWIWREVLIGLPLYLRHVSFSTRVFTRAAQGSVFPAKAFDVIILRFTYFLFPFFSFFHSPVTRLRLLLAGICRLKTSPFFYWLRPFSLSSRFTVSRDYGLARLSECARRKKCYSVRHGGQKGVGRTK